MFGKKVIVSTILIVLVVSSLFGLYSDDYVLGAYTYLKHWYEDIYFQYLSEANYNNHICNIYSPGDIDGLYNKSNNNNLDMIIIDSYWEPDYQNPQNGRVGVYNLTRANNYYYEAEYSEPGEILVVKIF